MKTLVVRKSTQARTIGQALLAVAALAITSGSAFAVDGDISAQLSTAATTAITAVLGVMGVILVAAFAIPVGKKTYRVIKSAVSGG